MNKCQYCQNETNDFITMNQAFECSGIEIAINRKGKLRVRFSGMNEYSQEIVEVKYCPMCGKKFMKGN